MGFARGAMTARSPVTTDGSLMHGQTDKATSDVVRRLRPRVKRATPRATRGPATGTGPVAVGPPPRA